MLKQRSNSSKSLTSCQVIKDFHFGNWVIVFGVSALEPPRPTPPLTRRIPSFLVHALETVKSLIGVVYFVCREQLSEKRLVLRASYLICASINSDSTPPHYSLIPNWRVGMLPPPHIPFTRLQIWFCVPFW